MSLTLRTSCLATAYSLSTFSTKMATAQDATVEVTEAPENTEAILPQPTAPYTGVPVPENPTLTGTLVDPEDQSIGKIRTTLADTLDVEKSQITVTKFDVVTGEVEFTISGDNAQTAGQMYLSLEADGMSTIGMKADSAALVSATTDRANSSDKNDGTWWKVLLGVLAALLVIGLLASVAFFLAKGKKQKAVEGKKEKPRGQADNSDLDLVNSDLAPNNSDLMANSDLGFSPQPMMDIDANSDLNLM